MLHKKSTWCVQMLFFLLAVSFANCNKSGAGKVYRISGSMTIDGWTRTYLLNLPPNYYDSTVTTIPLVVALHGFGGSATQMEQDYGITDKANAEGFIVVYPNGTPTAGRYHLQSWNAGTCCAISSTDNIDDVHFISTLIDQLSANYKVDKKRVYVAGMSNGAMMAYTLACDLSDKVAAITSVSGTLLASSPCSPSRAVPILDIHSTADTKVPFYGGIGLGGQYFPPVDSGINVWAALDTCPATPTVTQGLGYTFSEWKSNNGSVVIDSYLTQDGGHSWPGGLKPRAQADPPSTALNATDLLWTFFQHYTLP